MSQLVILNVPVPRVWMVPLVLLSVGNVVALFALNSSVVPVVACMVPELTKVLPPPLNRRVSVPLVPPEEMVPALLKKVLEAVVAPMVSTLLVVSVEARCSV
jgi:hypothetical protein